MQTKVNFSIEIERGFRGLICKSIFRLLRCRIVIHPTVEFDNDVEWRLEVMPKVEWPHHGA